MLSKTELKLYSSLLKKKFRDEENKFIVEGKKILYEGLQSPFKCEAIIYTHSFAAMNEDFIDDLMKYDIRTEILRETEFSKLTDTQTPQGIVAVFLKPKAINLIGRHKIPVIIVCLENISDPGNLGTIIRNCDWFGVNEIVLDKTCADIYNPKTIRATMGSIFRMNLHEKIDLAEYLTYLKKINYTILCADLEGENILEYSREIKTAVIFANEANGPSMRTISLSDKKITIPKLGNAESLNVAGASAVILAMLTKQV